MGSVMNMFDGLVNALTGAGTRRDPRTRDTYVAMPPMDRAALDAAYRGSGLMRKIITIPALDMVREWRSWKLPADDITKVENEEKRLKLRQRIREVEVLRRLGGGALILGLPGEPEQEAPKDIGAGKLEFVNVASRWHLGFTKLQMDARLPGFGEPVMWTMASAEQGQIEIHPSRVIPFRADIAATQLSPFYSSADGYWGESVVAQVLQAVQDNDTARASFAALMHKARLLRIGIPGLNSIVASPGGEAAIQNRLSAMVLAESIHNASIYDSGDPEGKGGEKIDDATYTFTGVKDVLREYGEFVAAISDIPATRLLGRSPEGMNSSGESQQKDWQKKIRAMQTLDLGPCLDRLDPFLVSSALGTVPEGEWYEFNPLDTPGEKERAEIFKTEMEAAEKALSTGAIPDEAFARGFQSLLIDRGYLPELETALEEMPEDERYGILTERGEIEALRLEAQVANQNEPGEDGEGQPVRRAANDARPRSLYIYRKLLNADELIEWAKSQGFETTLEPDDLHVTITFSRAHVDWIEADSAWDNEDGTLTVKPGGARIVEPLGDKGAVALLFNSSELSWRHEQLKRIGASHDHDGYQPHVTITYAKPASLDLEAVEPYRGKLEFGPEIFEEIDEDWNAKITEV